MPKLYDQISLGGSERARKGCEKTKVSLSTFNPFRSGELLSRSHLV
jgi:hypothetical protein